MNAMSPLEKSVGPRSDYVLHDFRNDTVVSQLEMWNSTIRAAMIRRRE